MFLVLLLYYGRNLETIQMVNNKGLDERGHVRLADGFALIKSYGVEILYRCIKLCAIYKASKANPKACSFLKRICI